MHSMIVLLIYMKLNMKIGGDMKLILNNMIFILNHSYNGNKKKEKKIFFSFS
jgi:hypothetical protein